MDVWGSCGTAGLISGDPVRSTVHRDIETCLFVADRKLLLLRPCLRLRYFVEAGGIPKCIERFLSSIACSKGSIRDAALFGRTQVIRTTPSLQI